MKNKITIIFDNCGTNFFEMRNAINFYMQKMINSEFQLEKPKPELLSLETKIETIE